MASPDLSALPSRQQWSIRWDGPSPGAVNMIADAQLLDQAARGPDSGPHHGGQAVLRLYQWTEPTISLGYGQRLNDQEQQRLKEAGVTVVQRPSGGRALLHDPSELTYCVVLPRKPHPSISDNYRLLTGWLYLALRDLGMPVECCTPEQERSSFGHMGCYGLIQSGEILLGGEKLVGSAQRLQGQALLQHGAIPMQVDLKLLQHLMPGHVHYRGLHQLGFDLEPLALLEALERRLPS